MQPKKTIIDLPVYVPGRPIEAVKKQFGLTEVIKLASNENPFGCSPKVKQAIIDEVENTYLYPDGASTELKAVLSKHLGIRDEQIVFGAGSDEVITMIARAYFVPGDETIMASHTFPQYRHNAKVEGAVCIELPLIDGVHDLKGMLERINDKTKVIWLCNPNNPTGTVVSDEALRQFMRKVPKSVLVILDEAYIEFRDPLHMQASLQLMNEYPNVVLLRTFSKIYGMASLRIGYGMGHPDVIRTINQVREPFNTTRYAQVAAIAALADQSFIDECRNSNKIGINYLTTEFTRLGLPYFPANGNFIMVDVHQSAEVVFEALLRKGIIVRGGHKLGFPTKIRVTVGSREQNEKFISALEQVLQEVTASGLTIK